MTVSSSVLSNMSDDGIDDVSELLAFTSNELKGELKPAEVVVSHSQIVAASRAHNVTLINIHSAITKLQNDMDEMRTALSKRIDNLETKVDRWGVRVEDLEKRCTVCESMFIVALSFCWLYFITLLF